MLVECARRLRKRWAWTAVAVILALAAGAGVYKVITPQQESKAQVLLVPSINEPGVKGPSNPYLGLGTSLAIVASVLQVSLTDDKTALALEQSGNRAPYQIAPDLAENAGPILLVSTKSKSAAMTQRTLNAVLAEVTRQLRKLQLDQKVPESQLITAIVLTASAHPSPVHKTQTQPAIVASVGLLLALILLILGLDRALEVRRQHRLRGQDATKNDAWRRTTKGEPRLDESATATGPAHPMPRRSPRRTRVTRVTGEGHHDSDRSDVSSDVPRVTAHVDEPSGRRASLTRH
jgi:hypothetical protein